MDQNVLHVQLFLHLKRNFPQFKDEEVTDCIRRIGFSKENCEKELQQRSNVRGHLFRRSKSAESAMPMINGEHSSSEGSEDVEPTKYESELPNISKLNFSDKPYKNTRRHSECRSPLGNVMEENEISSPQFEKEESPLSPEGSDILSPVFSMSPLPPTNTTTSPPSTSRPSSSRTSCSSSQSEASSLSGTKHVSSLHFIPCPPFEAFHAPVAENFNRSYTSVNLQLRTPNSEHPSVTVSSSPQSLTYCAATLDQRHNSRSSLQISIGPMGGSCAAVRTNIRPQNALHIQYCSGNKNYQYRENSQTPVHRERRERPQSWVVAETKEPLPLSRRTSLPESNSSSVEANQSLNIRCTKCNPLSGVANPSYNSMANLSVNSLLMEAVIKDQMEKKKKLEHELQCRLEEKMKLDIEIKELDDKFNNGYYEFHKITESQTSIIAKLENNNIYLQAEIFRLEEKIAEEGDVIEENERKWACRICTFENHPNLNQCEMCTNYRVRNS